MHYKKAIQGVYFIQKHSIFSYSAHQKLQDKHSTKDPNHQLLPIGHAERTMWSTPLSSIKTQNLPLLRHRFYEHAVSTNAAPYVYAVGNTLQLFTTPKDKSRYVIKQIHKFTVISSEDKYTYQGSLSFPLEPILTYLFNCLIPFQQGLKTLHVCHIIHEQNSLNRNGSATIGIKRNQLTNLRSPEKLLCKCKESLLSCSIPS